MNVLEDPFHYEGSIDDSLLAKLKELNIHDAKQIIDGKNDDASKPKTATFAKAGRAPPPQCHLESSRGKVKDRVAAHELKSNFRGRKIKDFGL